MYEHVPQVESLGYVKFNPEVKVEGDMVPKEILTGFSVLGA